MIYMCLLTLKDDMDLYPPYFVITIRGSDGMLFTNVLPGNIMSSHGYNRKYLIRYTSIQWGLYPFYLSIDRESLDNINHTNSYS